MSITNDVFLPELTRKTIEEAVRLFAKQGVIFMIDPADIETEPTVWDGAVAVEVTVSNKRGSETYETGFELYKEPFNLEAGSDDFDFSQIPPDLLKVLKACRTRVTTRSGTSTRAGIASSICFAAALAESGKGIWRDGDSGEFCSEPLSAILQNPVAEELFDIIPEPDKRFALRSKGAALQKSAQQAGSSEVISTYIPYSDLLVKPPITDYLLRCVVIDGTKKSFQLQAMYLPLYACPGFASNYWIGIGWKSEQGRNLSWHARDVSKLEEAMQNRADPFLSRAKSVSEFIRQSPSLLHDRFSGDDELIALSYIMAEEFIRAGAMLFWIESTLQLSLLDPAISASEKQHRLDKHARIKEIRLELGKDPRQAKLILKQRASKMLKELELDGLEAYVEP